MQRETITLKLPVSGSDLILKKNLIGSERRALANVFIDNGLTIGVDGKVGTITSKITNAAENLAWQTVIVSIGGQSENIVDLVLTQHSDDYDFIVSEVNKITANKSMSEKKTI